MIPRISICDLRIVGVSTDKISFWVEFARGVTVKMKLIFGFDMPDWAIYDMRHEWLD